MYGGFSSLIQSASSIIPLSFRRSNSGGTSLAFIHPEIIRFLTVPEDAVSALAVIVIRTGGRVSSSLKIGGQLFYVEKFLFDQLVLEQSRFLMVVGFNIGVQLFPGCGLKVL